MTAHDDRRDRPPGLGWLATQIEAERVLRRLRRRMFSASVGPLRIDRFEVGGRLGSGGFGEVFAAHDRELDRRIALKLLFGTAAGGGWKREARTLAQVSHPNVVQVFDLGTCDVEADGRSIRRDYIAMELVSGAPLDRWCRDVPRSPAQILGVFEQAARGLQAAHDLGVVHGDVKPSNIVVGTDGRVRVLDFGLAQRRRPTSAAPDADPGPWAGTPGYMAPEQRTAGPSPAADQYALFVTMQQCLAGDTGPGGGRRVRAVMDRGLAVDPRRRWPSMGAVAAALRRCGTAGPKRWLGPAVLGVGAVAAIASVGGLGPAPRDPRCTLPSPAGSWNGETAARLQAAFAESGVESADDVAAHVVRIVDAHVARWGAVRDSACASAPADDSGSCLSRAAVEIDLWLETWAQPDPARVTDAAAAARALRRPDQCDAAPITAEQQAVYAEIAQARALTGAGEHGRAVEIATGAERAAAGLGDDIARSEALLQRAYADHGNAVSAPRDYEAALWLAMSSSHDTVVIAAALKLALLADEAGKPSQSQRWLRVAGSAVARSGTTTDRISLLAAQARRAHWAGEFDAARASVADALALIDERDPASVIVAAELYRRDATILEDRGDFAAARDLAELAIARFEHAVGNRHPGRVRYLQTLAIALEGLGDLAAARVLLEDALTLAAADDDRPDPILLNSLGIVLEKMDAPVEAAAAYQRAMTIARERDDDLFFASVATNQAALAFRLDRPAEALAGYDTALEIFVRRYGDGDYRTATVCWGRGKALHQLGRLEEARAALERAIDCGVQAGMDPAAQARPHADLGAVLWDLGGDRTRARALVTQANAAFAAGGEAWEADRASTHAWLQTHPEGAL